MGSGARVIIVVEGTQSMEPHWADIRRLYIDPILSIMDKLQRRARVVQREQQQAGTAPPGPPFVAVEYSLVVFHRCDSLVESGVEISNGWTSDLAEVGRGSESTGSVGLGFMVKDSGSVNCLLWMQLSLI